MAYEAITYETRGAVGIITLNRPEVLNAISATLRNETHDAVARAHDDDAIRVLVVTGNGRGFCSGADLSGPAPVATGVAETMPTQNEKMDDLGWIGRWAKMLHDFDKPVIGAINGVCAGAGMSLALSCDVRIGCEASRFKVVFPERSLSPDSGLSFFLPRVVGYAAAADLIFTSRAVGAEEALRLGLLNRMSSSGDLLADAVAYAEEMAQWPPLAIRSAKRVLQNNFEADLDTAVKYESVGLSFARRATNDARESRLAFIEKRKGIYTGT